MRHIFKALATETEGAFSILMSIAISAVDIREYRIPNILVGAWALGILAISAVLDPASIAQRLSCGAAYYLGLRAFSLLPGIGLGMGDVKFAAAAALCLGFTGTWLMLASACLLGIATESSRLGKAGFAGIAPGRIAFAPYLCLGTIIALATRGNSR